MIRLARDGEELPVHSTGGDWLITWHPPFDVPPGLAHGANAFCVTADGGVVLISNDGTRWGWPGGRPEGDEIWEQTLRREVLEETCCAVRDARLLGFCRARCLSGLEEGRVLARSIWRADVDLMPWGPRFEIGGRSSSRPLDSGVHSRCDNQRGLQDTPPCSTRSGEMCAIVEFHAADHAGLRYGHRQGCRATDSRDSV